MPRSARRRRIAQVGRRPGRRSNAVGRDARPTRPRRRRRLGQAPRGEPADERGDPLEVGGGVLLAAAVVLGPLDDPEFLGLAGPVEEGPGDVDADVGVLLAVDRQPGAGASRAAPRSTSAYRQWSLHLGPEPGGPAEELEDRRSASPSRRPGCRRRSRPSGGCRRSIVPRVGKAPSVTTPQTPRVAGRDAEGGPAAPADAEEADPGGVGVGPGPEVGERGLEVVDLVLGHPLERACSPGRSGSRRGSGSRS